MLTAGDFCCSVILSPKF